MSVTSPPTSFHNIISPNQSRGIDASSNRSGHVMSAGKICGKALLHIPAIAELAQIDHWVAWQLTSRNGRQDKVPFNVATHEPASSSDPSTWNSFATALCVRARYTGIGFMFSADDPYTGI